MKKKIRSASLCDLSSLRISFYKDNNDKLFRTHKLNVAKSCDAKLPYCIESLYTFTFKCRYGICSIKVAISVSLLYDRL